MFWFKKPQAPIFPLSKHLPLAKQYIEERLTVKKAPQARTTSEPPIKYCLSEKSQLPSEQKKESPTQVNKPANPVTAPVKEDRLPVQYSLRTPPI